MSLLSGICFQSFVPLRIEPDDRAEQVSQVLFGEHFRISEDHKGFSHIELEFDGYRGWIDSKAISFAEDGYDLVGESDGMLITHRAITYIDSNEGGYPLLLGAGSTLYPKNGIIRLGKYHYQLPAYLYEDGIADHRKALIRYAMELVNTPYLWGGRTSFGIDCSGFVQNLYKQIGIQIPRDSSIQAGCGSNLSFINEIQPGDLAFFDNEEGTITHVGMVLNNHQIVHASGCVRIDRIDHQGIFNTERNAYTHKLRLLKRFLDSPEFN